MVLCCTLPRYDQKELEGSLQATESALAAVAISLGAEEDCVRRWKDAVSEATPGTSDDEPLAVSLPGKGSVRTTVVEPKKVMFSEKKLFAVVRARVRTVQ